MCLTRALHPNPFEANGMPPTYETMHYVFSPKRMNPSSTSLPTMIKSLDAKLADIHANPSGSKAFIIADAKDADMAFGIAAPGPRRDARTKDRSTRNC
jgi:hypothetical protein